jgi:peptide/nickel transport system ATP-binding protein
VKQEATTYEHASLSPGQTLIRAEGLVKRFKVRRGVTATALDGVDLSLKAGESVAIVGESGSGKTTLLQSLAWLKQPDAGRVYWHGEPVDEMDPDDLRRFRRDFQFVFQGASRNAFNPRFTVADVLGEPLQVFPEAARPSYNGRIRYVMQRVGLDLWYAPRRPHELSQGERQRVNIARALSCGPKVLLCDEPTAGLDVVSQAPILSLLRDLREREGLSIVFATHNVALAPWVSDRCLVLHEGRIVEDLPSDRLREAQHSHTRALVAAIPQIP